MAGRLAATMRRQMRHRATVKTDTGSGAFEAVDTTDLPCLLMDGAGGGAGGYQRAEGVAGSAFLWVPEYEMPHYCRVHLNGQVWHPTVESIGAFHDRTGTLLYRHCDLVLVGAA